MQLLLESVSFIHSYCLFHPRTSGILARMAWPDNLSVRRVAAQLERNASSTMSSFWMALVAAARFRGGRLYLVCGRNPFSCVQRLTRPSGSDTVAALLSRKHIRR